MEGWIKLHRKMLDNPIITKDSDYLSVWIYLLLNTTHKEYDVLFKGKRTTLKKGQLLTGRKSISEKLKINENKVQRILKTLESEHQIEQQSSNKNRLITIVSWDKYQEDEQQIEQQLNNKRTTSEQQVNTNKNVKNIKNDKNVKEKEEEKKIHFAEFVSMTNAEYEKLVSTYGKDFADQCINILDNYKGSSGKKYKSDYRAILNWVIDRVKEQRNKQTSKSNYEQREYSNLDFLYKNKGVSNE